MIDLTPLDVRKKRGDFAKALRGYDAEEVDSFIELVAERLEELVKENLRLSESAERLTDQVSVQEGREKAVQEALVTAQTLREDVKQQAQREADLSQRETRALIDQMLAEADGLLEESKQSLAGLERQRLRFLKSFRTLLERELDGVEVEESRIPLEDVAHEMELGRIEDSVEEDEPAEFEDSLSDENAEALAEAEDDAIVTMVEVEEVVEVEEEVEAEEDEPEEEVLEAEAVEVHADVLDEPDDVEDTSPGLTEGDGPEFNEPDDTTDHMGDVEEPVVVEVEGEEQNAAEPSPDEERGAVAEDEDASLWLNSLLDGESQDKGRWS